jgi:spermidine synthase
MGRVRLKEAQSERFARARPGFEWVAAAESRYQRLELARRGGRYTPSANAKIGGQYTLFANGKVAFSFPNRIDNRRQVALAMAQCVRGAERVLVLGAAEGELLAELLEYPSLKHVDAVALDPRTADLVSPYLDARAKAALGDPRVRVHFTDPRAFVNRTSHDEPYDLVLVNAPDPTSASVNRLFTREFFERTRRAMNPDGVLITGMVSAANYQGKEVRDFAGSVVATVRSVFPKVALAPGDWMTVIASVAPDVATVDAEELSRRFRRVRPPSGEFNPEAFATLLPEGEVRAVAERFADVQGPINRDAQPMTYYLATILWSRFSGSTWTRDALEAVEKQGLALALIPFLSFWLARLLYVGLSRDGGSQVRADRFNAWLTVAGLGATGMAASLMLVLAYQSSVGLLYGRIGLLAALFMAGIGAGSLLTGRLREGTASARFLLMSSLGAMSVLFLLFRRPLLGDAAWAGAAVMMSLAIAGALLGVAFAAAARILRDSGGRTGAWLDAADHAGGALGAIATGSVAIPLLGFGATALLGATVTAGLFALNAQAFWLERRRGARREIAEPEPSAIKDRFRPVGWMLAALLVSAYALGARIHYRPAEAKPSFRISPNELAQWSGTAAWEERALPFAHWRAADAGGRGAPRVAFATDQTAPDVRGYAGPITLAVDMDGKELRGARLLDCRETPSYVLGLEAWLRGFAGKPLGRGWELGRDIDGVTGATVTCQAVVETLNRSVYRGGVDLLDLDLDPGAYRQGSWQRNLLAPAPVTVALCFILLVPCYRWGGDRARLLFLILMVCVLGVYLNRAVTLLEVGNVSLGRWPSPSNAAGAVMLGGVAVLTLLWGSVFCGYLCPFGALQEIAARLSDPRGEKRFRLSGGLKALRSLRYVLAALSLAGFWLACDAAGAWGGRQWLAWSPLQTFFAASKSKLLWLGGGAALLATFAVPRFWCLYLCPTGAVLSAWNRFALLRRTRLFRAPDYGACDLGAAATQPRDCLRCNRCRVLPRPQAELAPSRRRTIPGVLTAVLVCLLVSYSARVDVLEREGGTASAVASEGASRARDLDVRAIDDALRTGRLSDREASFYESLTPTPTPSRDGN